MIPLIHCGLKLMNVHDPISLKIKPSINDFTVFHSKMKVIGKGKKPSINDIKIRKLTYHSKYAICEFSGFYLFIFRACTFRGNSGRFSTEKKRVLWSFKTENAQVSCQVMSELNALCD